MQVVDNNGNVFGGSSIEITGPDGKPKTIGGGGGGAPTGPAGGDLTGTYPNPGVNWSLGSPVYDLLYYPLSTNPAGYITSSALTPYLTSATAALTYYPLTNPSAFISGITGTMVTTALGFTPYNASNPAGYITGITSGDVTTALGFTPYSNANPSGFITSAALAGYLTSAIAASTYYPLTNPSGFISGITGGMVTTALGFTPVTDARNLTINGVTYDLTADRTWTISAGSSLEIKDQGTTLTTAATSIDFTGSEVTASVVGTAVTVNVVRTLSPPENLFNYYNFI